MVKALIRYSVIAGLVGGAAVLVAGPERVGALLNQARGSVNAAIDEHIEDPVALRAQLRSLEGQYPERIAEVRGDLAELKQQTASLHRDLQVGQRVIELAEGDLSTLQGLLSHAENRRDETAALASTGAMRPTVIRVVFNDESLSLDEAYQRAAQVRGTRDVYVQRVADIERDLQYMGQQETRLAELLTQLETEQAQFQAQIFQLDGQIETIARNDRLIEMMEDRKETIDEHSRYRAASLDQLQARLADLRARQEAQLQSLSRASAGRNYEDRAKIQIDATRPAAPETSVRPTIVRPQVIEIRPEDVRPAPTPSTIAPNVG